MYKRIKLILLVFSVLLFGHAILFAAFTNPVTDLAASQGTVTGEVRLDWTEPLNPFYSYDLKFATYVITDANFSMALPVAPQPMTMSPGMSRTYFVNSLANNKLFYFAMKIQNMAMTDWSFVSTVASSYAKGDSSAPAVITTLAVNPVDIAGGQAVRLSWFAPGDNGWTGVAASYQIRYAFSDINSSAAFLSATDIPNSGLIPVPTASGTNQMMLVTGLPSGTLYFAVKAYDAAGNFSISNSVSKVVQSGGSGEGTILMDMIDVDGVAGIQVPPMRYLSEGTTFTYIVGSKGIGPGGQVVITIPNSWTQPSLNSGFLGYVSWDSTSAAKPLITITTDSYKVIFEVASSTYGLVSGDVIQMVYHDAWTQWMPQDNVPILVRSKSNAAQVLGDVSGYPVVDVVAGPPRYVSFPPEAMGLTIRKNMASSLLQLRVVDNSWNVTKATANITVYLSGMTDVYNPNTMMYEYTVDTTSVFSATQDFASTINSIVISTGESYAGFYYKTNAGSSYTIIKATYVLDGMDSQTQMNANLVSGGITDARIHKGDYNYGTSIVMGNNDSAFIDFSLTDANVNWSVLISTSPDRKTGIWTYWGWGIPNSGQLSWNGYVDYYDMTSMIWRHEKAPNGTYYVRIRLGNSEAIVDDTLSITIESQEITGRVTDVSGNPLSEVYINAFGPSISYTITDSTGYYKLSGLVSGTYTVSYYKYGFAQKTVSAASPGTQNVQIDALGYLKINAQRTLHSDSSVIEPDQWSWLNIHDSSYVKFYQGSLHFAVGVSTSDNDMYTYSSDPKYQIENTTDNYYDGGRWTIVQVEPGTYSIQAYLDGYSEVTKTVTVTSGETKVINDINFTLKKTVSGNVSIPEALASGTVYVSVEAKPVGHSGSSGYGWCMIEAGNTISTYTIYGLDTGNYSLKATASGYGKGTASLTVANELESAALIILSAGGALSGTVTVEGDTTDPALGIMGDPFSLYINAWSPDAYSYGWTQLSVAQNSTSASASFSLKGLDDGTYWINTWLSGFELEGAIGWNGIKTTVSGGSGTVNIKLKRLSGKIQARLIVPGNDYGNVKVYLEGNGFWDNDWYMGVTPTILGNSGATFDSGTGILTISGLGTSAYKVRAVYSVNGIEKSKYVMVTNGLTKTVDLDVSGNVYSVSGMVSLSASNPPANIANMSVLVDTAPIYNTTSIYNGSFWISSTSFRVFAVDYNKLSLATSETSGVASGLIANDGQYKINGLVPGVYMLRIPSLELDGNTDNGKETAFVEKRVVVTGDATGQDLEVTKGYKVSGQIKFPAGMYLTKDVYVYVFKANKFKVSNFMSGAWTNYIINMRLSFVNENTKSYELRGLAPGEYVVAVNEMTGMMNRQFANSSINVKVVSADVSGQNVQLSKGGKIIMKLRDASSGAAITPQNKNQLLPTTYVISAIANPWVEGGWGDTNMSMNQSVFELAFLPEASYDVMLGQSSFGYMPMTAMMAEGGGESGNKTNYASKTMTGIKVRNGQSVDLGTIDIKQGLTITGTVTDVNGSGIPNIPVIAVPAMTTEWTSELRGFTDINGKYSIVGLDPDNKYYDIVACPRIDTSLFSEYFFFGAGGLNYGEKVKSMIDATLTKNVDFVLSAANGAVKGKVVTEDGGQLQNPSDINLPTAKVYLQPEDQMPRTNPLGDIVINTEIDGTFSAEALSPGYYRLFILSGGYASYSKTLNITDSEQNVGIVTLKRGAKISGSITKDGVVDGKPQYPSTTEIKSIIAATDDLSEMLVGSLSLSGDKTVSGYEINGFQTGNSYNMMYLCENDEMLVAVRDNQSVIGFTVPYSTYTKTDFNLTFRQTAPAVFSRARKTSTTAYAIVFDLTGALRKSIPADDDLASILTVTQGGGAISAAYMTPNRKTMSCVYMAPAGEKLFSIRLHAYSKTVDPLVGSEFEIDETLQYLTGLGARNKIKISNLRGGKITLDGDSSSVSFGPGTFDVNSSTVVVFVTFTRAESLEDLKTAPSKRGGPRFSIPREAGAYPERTYSAMKLAQAAAVDPFSSFYDIMLPAGISRALKNQATLALQYSTDVDPNTLNVYYYDDKNNVYLLENTNKKVDADSKVISITVKHLSTYVLFQSNAAIINGGVYDGPLFVYNFPNPFDLEVKSVNLVNASNQTGSITGTMIHYGLPSTISGEVEIKIYNVVGELVRTINDGTRTGGAHYYTEWNGKNDAGKKVASGVYIAKFSIDKKNEKFFKMAVIK